MLFIAAGAIVFARLVWVQMFSGEVAYNARRLAGRIFTEVTVPAQRGGILARSGDRSPRRFSVTRWRSTSLRRGSIPEDLPRAERFAGKLLAAFSRTARRPNTGSFFREEHARRYRLVRPRDTLYARSEGWFARLTDRMRGEEFIRHKVYDTLRDHTPVEIFPATWIIRSGETLKTYPLLNWNMGWSTALWRRPSGFIRRGELARRTIGKKGDQGNYGIEDSYHAELSGRDGKAKRQRIARGFYGRVAGEHVEPGGRLRRGNDARHRVAGRRGQGAAAAAQEQSAEWGTTIVMETRTGEILALANLGRTSEGTYAERENYALSRSMEPGSTFSWRRCCCCWTTPGCL